MSEEQGKSGDTDGARRLLRHTVATVAYRGGKALRGAPEGFAGFRPGDTCRSAGEILAHVGDLFDWALSKARGIEAWRESEPLPWNEEVQRFYASIKAFDDHLESAAPLGAGPEELFQGPVADALTHIGQITVLRRLAGAALRAENYARADIHPGRVGPEQTPPRREF